MLGDGLAEAYGRELEHSFIPNFRHGRIDIPKRHRDTTRIPIIAAYVGETISAGTGLGLDPYQKQNAIEQMRGWTPKNGTEDHLRQMAETISAVNERSTGELITPTESILGFVTSTIASHGVTVDDFVNLGKNNVRLSVGRPIIGLVMREGVAEVSRPVTLMHELRHVQQFSRQPIMPDCNTKKYEDLSLRMELEAYHLGAIFGAALFRSDDSRYHANLDVLNDVGVERIRKDNGPASDAFAPRGVIRNALLERGLDF